MPLPTKPTRPLHETGRDSEESSTPSNNLWVGNLTPDVRDSDLMDLFAQYGALDSVTSYSARSYAFVFFKRIEDAKAAKNALQGFSFRGNSLKIEFARPVCSHLCALLIFNFSSDSCIVIIIYSNLIDFFFQQFDYRNSYFRSMFTVIFSFNFHRFDFPAKLLCMLTRFSNQIHSLCNCSFLFTRLICAKVKHVWSKLR
jgi:RNA recognition motif-containing protein